MLNKSAIHDREQNERVYAMSNQEFSRPMLIALKGVENFEYDTNNHILRTELPIGEGMKDECKLMRLLIAPT